MNDAGHDPRHAAGNDAGAANELAFPSGFVWGTATASYQSEGAVT